MAEKEEVKTTETEKKPQPQKAVSKRSYKNVSKTRQAAFGRTVNVGETVTVPEKADDRQMAKFTRAIEFGFFE